MTEEEQGPLELCWYAALCWLLSVIYHRFAGNSWTGHFPAAGATMVVFFVNIPIALSAREPLRKAIRMIVPLVLLYLFISHGDGDSTWLESVQQQIGFGQFLLLCVGTVLATAFTSSSVLVSSKKQGVPAVRGAAKPPDPAALEDSFNRIIGQEHVIEPLKEIADIARSGIRVGKKNAPHAVLLFLGPTGVGKTEAAMALAEAVYGTKDAVIRFDMGQFTDAHQASRFYGPPPGYAGYEEGGQLTRAVARRPRAVVLLDEVEKAHPQIWDAFLPVFDEGYIVDGSTNQRVDMTKTIIVLTSNLLAGKSGLSNKSAHEIKEELQSTGTFRPELIGRINDVLVFNALGGEAISEILKRRLDAALWSLAEQGISLQVSESDLSGMVEEVKAAKFGVRQIDDVVRKYLRKVISEVRGQPARMD